MSIFLKKMYNGIFFISLIFSQMYSMKRIEDHHTHEMIAAVEAGHLADVLAHLELGVPVNAKLLGSTALFRAASNGQADIIKGLCERGASKYILNIMGIAPMQEAIRKDHANVVGVLCELQHDKGMVDMQGNSLVHLAAQNESGAVLRIVLAYGCNVNSRNLENQLPLHKAVTTLSSDCTQELINVGSLLHVHDNKGCLPLHYAAQALLRCNLEPQRIDKIKILLNPPIRNMPLKVSMDILSSYKSMVMAMLMLHRRTDCSIHEIPKPVLLLILQQSFSLEAYQKYVLLLPNGEGKTSLSIIIDMTSFGGCNAEITQYVRHLQDLTK